MENKNKVTTYDAATISNAEIIAPSIDKTKEMLEVRALRQAYAAGSITRDAVCEVLGNNTIIKLKEAPNILRAVAAVVTAKREALNTKKTTNDSKGVNVFDAETINKMNEEFYRR